MRHRLSEPGAFHQRELAERCLQWSHAQPMRNICTRQMRAQGTSLIMPQGSRAGQRRARWPFGGVATQSTRARRVVPCLLAVHKTMHAHGAGVEVALPAARVTVSKLMTHTHTVGEGEALGPKDTGQTRP